MKLSGCAIFILLSTTIAAHAVPVKLRVVGADNKPLVGISVQYADYADISDERPNDTLSAQTAADGTLALDLRGVSGRAGEAIIRLYADTVLGNARVRSARFGYGAARLIAGDNTLVLRASAQVRGVVRNAANEPIAGAQVKFLGAEKSETDYSNQLAQYGLAPIVATTDAAGQWQIADLPRGYARFVVSAGGSANDELKFWIDKTEATAPDIKLRAAGRVRGRILDFQGKPLSGIDVDLGEEYGETARSDSDGRFELPGVPVGESALSFSSSSPDWLGIEREIKATIPTQNATVDIGDVRSDEGLLLSGRVVDVASKTPISAVQLSFFGGNNTLQTDAQGRFEGRIAKPFAGLRVLGDYIQISAISYVPNQTDQLDIGEILVGRAVRLRLDLRDEAGQLAPQAVVRLRSTNAPRIIYQTDSSVDEQGSFIGPLPAADYEIKSTGVWDVIEPKTANVALPVDGKTSAPLTIRLRALAPIRVSGRVVDGVGAPLGGVEVKIKARASGMNRTAISDENGVWAGELATAFDEPMLGEATFSPLAFVRGGEMTRDGAPENNRWKSTDIVMARTNIALTGRVTDDKGAAVAGARVSWQGNPKSEFVATDESGNFEIKDVPSAPLILLASDGSRFAQIAATPGVPAQIKFAPAPIPPSSAQIEELWDKTDLRSLWNLQDYAGILGVPRIYRAARRLDAGGNPARIGDGLSAYLQMRVARARTRAERFDIAVEGVELLRPIPMEDVNGQSAAQIAVLAARTDDAELQKWAASWYDSRKPRMPEKLDASYFSDSNLLATEFRMSAVGAALGRADSEKYRADGLTLMRNYRDGYTRLSWSSWGELLWMADSKRFDDEIAKRSKSQQMAFIVGALKIVDDAPAAKLLWTRLERLGADKELLATEAAIKANPDIVTEAAPDVNPDIATDVDPDAATEVVTKENSTSWLNSEQWLSQGRPNYARAVAATDPLGALDALEKIGNSPEACGIAIGIARAAIADGRAELARRALNLGLKGIYSNKSGTLALAMVARDFDAPLAEQLLARFRQSALTEDSARAQENRDKGWRDVAAYAFALRDFDAGSGRLLLEDQWNKRRNAPAAMGRGDENENTYAINEQQDLAWAMAAYDLPRALQWLGEIRDERDENNNRLELTRIAILAAASATPAERPELLAIRNL